MYISGVVWSKRQHQIPSEQLCPVEQLVGPCASTKPGVLDDVLQGTSVEDVFTMSLEEAAVGNYQVVNSVAGIAPPIKKELPRLQLSSDGIQHLSPVGTTYQMPKDLMAAV